MYLKSNIKRLLLLCSFIILFIGTGCSFSENNGIEITNWNILYEQDHNINRISKMQTWEAIEIPGMFRLPYSPKRDYQYIWIKSEFEIQNPGNYYGIGLGRIYHIDKVFINNKYIGGYSRDQFNSLHFPRYYQIPEKLLRKGKNEIYVYIGIYGIEYGGVEGKQRLLVKDKFFNSKILDNFLFLQLPIGIMFFFLSQIVFILILFFWKRKRIVDLISTIILLLWLSYFFAIYSPYYPFSVDFRVVFLWGCVSLTPIYFLLFIQYYYKIFVYKLNLIFIPTFILFTILSFSTMDTTSSQYIGRILGVVAIIISVPIHFYLIYFLNKKKPSKLFYIFLTMGFFPGSIIAFDVINYLFLYHFPPMFHIYALPVMVILFMLLRINDIIKKEIDLQILYNMLRSQLEISYTNDKKLNITESMKDKLDKVILFLNENYTSDISREGLARVLDLSPDYMSRMFKTYTGKRICDYINKLRVDEAVRLLLSDKKIIDIAFAVGFESLGTFNRVFLKEKKLTPSEFRQEI